jgi:ATP-dependent RNA helicase RhlE
VNFDMPNVPETYVHRIGRTARAGADGVAISLCDGEEMAFLRDIEKLIHMTIPVSGGRAGQGRAESEPAKPAFTRSPGAAEQRHRRRGGPTRKQGRHGQPSEPPRGIESVAFIGGKDRSPRAPRWAGRSRGT